MSMHKLFFTKKAPIPNVRESEAQQCNIYIYIYKGGLNENGEVIIIKFIFA